MHRLMPTIVLQRLRLSENLAIDICHRIGDRRGLLTMHSK